MKLRNRQQLGKQGENLAVSYLTKHGYRILQRNFKVRYGEIDIIALYDHTLIFVEVKTREDTSFGAPEEAVTPRKLREVVRTAQFFKSLHPELPESMRIDVIAILLEGNSIRRLEHIPNVTM